MVVKLCDLGYLGLNHSSYLENVIPAQMSKKGEDAETQSCDLHQIVIPAYEISKPGFFLPGFPTGFSLNLEPFRVNLSLVHFRQKAFQYHNPHSDPISHRHRRHCTWKQQLFFTPTPTLTPTLSPSKPHNPTKTQP